MIELLVAMAVFSFMLLIIVVGFINVVKLHNQALASNIAQDNARTAMAELVRGVRDSTGVVGAPGAGPNGTLCLADASGVPKYYYTRLVGTVRTLFRGDNCGAIPAANEQAITNSSVNVTNFVATVDSLGPAIVKPEVKLTVTVGSSNGTTTAGPIPTCNNNNADRQFCAVVTLTSGAVPR